MADNVIPFPGGRREAFREQPVEPYDVPTEPSSYVVRIDLDDSDPPIWRVVRLRSDLTLDTVHDVVQRSMGWRNSHLHRFVTRAGPDDPQGTSFDTAYDDEEEAEIPETSVRLDQVLRNPGDRLDYEYDFGDGWQHTLTLEEKTPLDDREPPASCLDGERACPPEDVGGIHHYNEVVAWLATRDPRALVDHPQLAETVEWLPRHFDAASFDRGETNRILTLSFGPPPPDVPNPAFQTLARRFDEHGRRYLGELAMLADLRAAPPTEDVVATAMRAYVCLLDAVGTDGLELTSAGYLRPADTERLVTAIGYETRWLGKGFREAHTPPILQLRTSAQALGLVRRHRGRLVLAPAGRAHAGDAHAVWQHIAARLPLGKREHELDAGVLALLCEASGSESRRVWEQYAGGLLELAGWRSPDGALEWVGYRAAWPTWHVLWTAGRQPDPWETGPEAGHLARAALLSPGV